MLWLFWVVVVKVDGLSNQKTLGFLAQNVSFMDFESISRFDDVPWLISETDNEPKMLPAKISISWVMVKFVVSSSPQSRSSLIV